MLVLDCVMSPWLLNVCMDSIVQEVNAKVLVRGLELVSANGETSQLLFVDDIALVVHLRDQLCGLVTQLGKIIQN